MLLETKDAMRVYVKGAPSKVLELCTKHFVAGGNGEEAAMTPYDKAEVERFVVKMGGKGLRAIAFAYKDIGEAVPTRQAAECDLTFVMAVFLDDPLRDKIPEIIQFVKHGKSTE